MTKVFSTRIVSLFAGLLFGLSLAATAKASTVVYQLDVNVTWSEATHPGAFPSTDGHFSWLGGATHNNAVSFWSQGSLASPGMVYMAETGNTSILVDEVKQSIGQGNARNALDWRHWFCPASTTNTRCGPTTVFFEIDSDFPLVTLATMIGPSPDWFVGVSGLSLMDSSGWLQELIVEAHPYDGGSQSANVFQLTGNGFNTPTEPISLITAQSGQLVGPGSLGQFRFKLVTPVPLPASFPLFAFAIAGLTLLGWRKRGAQNT